MPAESVAMRPTLEFGAFASLDGGEVGVAHTGPLHDVVVDHPNIGLSDRSHADLGLVGNAELAHENDVEWCPEGLRDRVKVLVGGAPVTRSFAREIGADGFGANAMEALAEVRRLLGTAA